MKDIELTYSEHCQSVSRDEKTVEIQIYSSGQNDWILEVVDEHGNSTVWDDRSTPMTRPIVSFVEHCQKKGSNP